jgi:hypothetical protein
MLLQLFLHRLSGFQIKPCVLFCSLLLETFSPNVTFYTSLILILLLFILFASSFPPPPTLYRPFYPLPSHPLLPPPPPFPPLPELRSLELFRLYFNFLRSMIYQRFLVSCIKHSISRHVTYNADDYCPRSFPRTMTFPAVFYF